MKETNPRATVIKALVEGFHETALRIAADTDPNASGLEVVVAAVEFIGMIADFLSDPEEGKALLRAARAGLVDERLALIKLTPGASLSSSSGKQFARRDIGRTGEK